LGKPAVKKKCLRCGKEFFDKPKRVKVITRGPHGEKKIEKTKFYEEQDYCQRCRHLITMVKQQPQKEKAQIRVIAKKVDFKQDVEVLRAIEKFNPRALDKLRKPLNKKKASK